MCVPRFVQLFHVLVVFLDVYCTFVGLMIQVKQ